MHFNEPVYREKFAAAYDRCVHTEWNCNTVEEKRAYMLACMEKIGHLCFISPDGSEGTSEKIDIKVLVKSDYYLKEA